MNYAPIKVPAGFTHAELAKRCGVSASMISQVLAGKKRPLILCLRIERASDGLIPRAELRPDVDWAEIHSLVCSDPGLPLAA